MMGHMFRSGYYGGNWDSMPDYMQKMMQDYYAGNQILWRFSGLMDFILWSLLVILLVALIRWVWRKGDKIK